MMINSEIVVASMLLWFCCFVNWRETKMSKRMKNTSQFISLILRHKPYIIDITLDEHGWADVQERYLKNL